MVYKVLLIMDSYQGFVAKLYGPLDLTSSLQEIHKVKEQIR